MKLCEKVPSNKEQGHTCVPILCHTLQRFLHIFSLVVSEVLKVPSPSSITWISFEFFICRVPEFSSDFDCIIFTTKLSQFWTFDLNLRSLELHEDSFTEVCIPFNVFVAENERLRRLNGTTPSPSWTRYS